MYSYRDVCLNVFQRLFDPVLQIGLNLFCHVLCYLVFQVLWQLLWPVLLPLRSGFIKCRPGLAVSFIFGYSLQPLKLSGWSVCLHKQHFKSRHPSSLWNEACNSLMRDFLYTLQISFQICICSGYVHSTVI